MIPSPIKWTAILLLVAGSARAGRPRTPPPAPIPVPACGGPREARLNALTEQDRPRYTGGDQSRNRNWHKEVKRQLDQAVKLATRYRAERKVALRRQLLDCVNRAGLDSGDLDGGNILRVAFAALREAGPPVDDPADCGDAGFAKERNHRLLRLIAMPYWRWRFATVAEQRVLAPYLDECERRPSDARPSGNNHDPSCGYMFEMNYGDWAVGGPAFEENKVPQSLADFAKGLPTNRPYPLPEFWLEYPLTLPAGSSPSTALWVGNQALLAKQYGLPYRISREVQVANAERAVASQRAEWDKLRAQREAEEAYRVAQRPVFDALWAKATHTNEEQQRLEDLAFRLGLEEQYLPRYKVIGFHNLQRACALGWGQYCDQLARMNQPARPTAVDFIGKPTGSASVTVRSYDQQGNYLGSSTTTRTDAVLSGARPQ